MGRPVHRGVYTDGRRWCCDANPPHSVSDLDYAQPLVCWLASLGDSAPPRHSSSSVGAHGPAYIRSTQSHLGTMTSGGFSESVMQQSTVRSGSRACAIGGFHLRDSVKH